MTRYVYGHGSKRSETSLKEAFQSVKTSNKWFNVCSVSSTTGLWKQQFSITRAAIPTGVTNQIFQKRLAGVKAVIRQNLPDG